jgi:hypothetical protein
MLTMFSRSHDHPYSKLLSQTMIVDTYCEASMKIQSVEHDGFSQKEINRWSAPGQSSKRACTRVKHVDRWSSATSTTCLRALKPAGEHLRASFIDMVGEHMRASFIDKVITSMRFQSGLSRVHCKYGEEIHGPQLHEANFAFA